MRFRKSIFVVNILFFSLVQPVMADSLEDIKKMMEQMKADYESRIEELEHRIDQLSVDQKQSNEQIESLSVRQSEQLAQLDQKIEDKTLDIEYVGRGNAPVGRGGVVVENPFGFGNVSLGGYFDFEYRDFANTDATFQQHRWIINIGAQPAERLRFNSELEIEYGGPNVPNADGEVKVEQAYADYLINDAVNARLGVVLAPFGRYNLYHDSDLQDLTDRPIVARDVIPTTWSEAGAGFFGEFNPVIAGYDGLNLGYEIYAVNGLESGFSDTGFSAARNSFKTDTNDAKSMIGRIVASPAIGHELGFSGYWGEYNKTDDSITGGAVDSLNKFGPVEFINEYAYFGVDEAVGSDVSNFFQGAYSQINYHFWPNFLDGTFLARDFDNPTFTLVGRYDWALIGDDSDAGSGDNEETRWTLGFNYRPIENFVWKIEYQWNQTENEALEAGDNDGFLTSVALGF